MKIPSATPNEVSFFKVVETFHDLAALFGTSNERLKFHLYSSRRPGYRQFKIRKAAGGSRAIAAPPSVLRGFQRKLLSCITAIVAPKANVHGFTAHRSVKTNAANHIASTVVLNLDLLNFFPSITFGRVYGMFKKHPFNFSHGIASVLAHMCCLDKLLPQGAPTSPAISNLICRGLDKDLSKLARLNHCQYSRYCDDLTFSTKRAAFSSAIVTSAEPRAIPILGSALLDAITRNGFTVNDRKTRCRWRTERQEVTGLTTNEKTNVARGFVRKIRAILHDAETRGVDEANERFRTLDGKDRIGPPPHVSRHVLGKLAYLSMVRGAEDPIYLRLAIRARKAFGMLTSPVLIIGSAALTPEFIERCLWILLGFDAGGDIRVQGTAFTLRGVGVVTALHNFEEACPRYELRLAADSSVAYPVEAVRSKDGVDLAILTSPAPLLAGLVRATSTSQMAESVTLAGFPVWHSPGDGLFVTPASITQVKTAGSSQYVLIDKDIRGGNSGGPLLSAGGEVIGIAVYDGTSAVAPNGSLSVHHLDELANEPARLPFG